jgi:hypothetical protein
MATQVPPAPTKARPRTSQNQGAREVIDLCDSDDDDLPVAKKTPVVREPVTQSPARRRPIVDELDHQNSGMSETVFENIRSTISQATLEFFGDKMTKHLVNLLYNGQQPCANPDFQSILPPYVKDEVRQHGSPNLYDPFTSPYASPLSQYHGLPGPMSTPPFSPRPFAVASPFSRPGDNLHPFTPPATPGHGGSYSPSIGFSTRETSVFSPLVRQSSLGESSPFTARNSTIGNGLGFSASLTSLEHPVKGAPSVSQATFQSLPLSQFSLSRPQVLQTDQRSKSLLNSHGQHLDPAATMHSISSLFTDTQHLQAGCITSNDVRAERSQTLVQERHKEANRNDSDDVEIDMADVSPHTEDTSMSDVTPGKMDHVRSEFNH